MERNRSLWIRNIDFNKFKDLIHLINVNNGALRATELEKLGEEEAILLKPNRMPMARSPKYFYRKAIENLGFAQPNKNKKYELCDSDNVKELLKNTKYKIELSYEQKEPLRKAIISNEVCRNYFFDFFMDFEDYDLSDFRNNGSSICLKKDIVFSHQDDLKETIILSIKGKNKELLLKKRDEEFAINQGLRNWALNLDLIDEYIHQPSGDRILYSLNPERKKEEIFTILTAIVREKNFQSNWIVIPFPDLITEIALATHIVIETIKEEVLELSLKNPKNIILIKSSTAFIDISNPSKKQKYIYRKLYPRLEGLGYISHIRINKQLLEIDDGKI